VTIDIIQAIDPDFIFDIPKPMMHDILDSFKGIKNTAWIEEVLLNRERIEAIPSLRHTGHRDHWRNEEQQVTWQLSSTY
jgi:hypothetical protein